MTRTQKYPNTESFVYENVNPKNRITGDCTIRALAGGMNISWEEAFKGLRDVELKLCKCDDDAINTYLKNNGWIKHKQIRHDDNTKYTGKEFVKYLSINFPYAEIGNVIVRVANHMYCIKPTYDNESDGFNCKYKIHDIWDSSNCCVGNYWIKEK